MRNAEIWIHCNTREKKALEVKADHHPAWGTGSAFTALRIEGVIYFVDQGQLIELRDQLSKIIQEAPAAQREAA